jgi:hypothetical protein
MHNYKGQLRRDLQDHTPTKSTWEKEQREYPYSKQESRHDSKYDTKLDDKYEPKFEPKN